MTKLLGIDVSTYNGKIDWATVYKSGVQFSIIKATQGRSLYSNPSLYLFTDSRFVENINNAFANNIEIGVYHFLTAKTIQESILEADYFASVLQPYKSKISLWACVDVEDDKDFENLSKTQLSNIVLTFCNRIASYGYIPMIYTNRNYLKYKLDYSILKDIDIWQAHWSTNKPTDVGDKLKIWQYGSGTVKGINGSVDLNFGYFELPQLYEKDVIRKSGIEEQTVDFINAYKYSTDLWYKLWKAMYTQNKQYNNYQKFKFKS